MVLKHLRALSSSCSYLYFLAIFWSTVHVLRNWKKMDVEVRQGLIARFLACLVYDFSSPALSLTISVITDFMGMVVGAWRSGLHSEFFVQFWVPGVRYRPFVCPFPWTSGEDWNGPSEPKSPQKGCSSAKNTGVLGGYGWEGSAEEETPWRRTYMSSSPIYLLLGGFMYCFHFIVCSLRKPFYSLLSNFPWLHACYKVFSWNVTAGQDSLELASLHLELFPWLQAVPVPAELLWHRELMGEVVVPGGFCDFCCLGAEALARFSGKLVLWCSCGHSLQYQL